MVITYLNGIFGKDSKKFVETEVIPVLNQKFGANVLQEYNAVLSYDPSWKLKSLKKISQMCGLVFEDDFFEYISPNPTKFFLSSPILIQNLVTFEPVVKMLNVAHRACGFSLEAVDTDFTRKQRLRVFKTSIHTFPRDKLAWYSLGKLYLMEGQLSGAESAFTRAIQIDPNFSDARKALDQLNSGSKSVTGVYSINT